MHKLIIYPISGVGIGTFNADTDSLDRMLKDCISIKQPRLAEVVPVRDNKTGEICEGISMVYFHKRAM